jgi:hypothetical protein
MSEGQGRHPSGGEILAMSRDHRRGFHRTPKLDCSLCREAQIPSRPRDGDAAADGLPELEPT